MLSSFLIILGILALFGAGGAEDARLIVILLKIIPIILIIAGIFMLVTCSS